MKKFGYIFLLLASFRSFCATEEPIWMAPSSILKPYNTTLSSLGRVQNTSTTTPLYALAPVNPDDENTAHVRYNIMFKETPIWGHQVIIHQQGRQQARLTGVLVHGIEQDIPDNQTILTESQATSAILSQVSTPIKAKEIEKTIYLDESNTAHMAYLLRFYTSNQQDGLKNPHYIIDASTGVILKEWDEAKTLIEGEGPGGNAIALPYRDGAFQYGDTKDNAPSLGRFPMDHWVFWCYMQTPDYRIINLENQWVYASDLQYIFPIYETEEQQYNLNAAYGFCWPWTTLYNNTNDLGYSPVNEAYSPMNDAMYFVNQTLEMYRSYGIEFPLGKNDLPIRVYTHIGGFDNAFALPTFYFSGTRKIKAHQQIVLSNGVSYFTALTQSIIPHELSHNFTALHSNLIYSGQSGGINESFSDMAAIALMDRIHNTHSFYWDGLDWSIGREATKNGKPLRSLEHPAYDGRSIENAKDYKKGLDVHYSSGVFNRAFYLLAHQPDWSVQDAFQVMLDANKNYWEAGTTFDDAACGVIQAAKDRGLDSKAVTNAFDQVGVTCARTLAPVG